MAGQSSSSSSGSSTSTPIVPEISQQLVSLLESFGSYLNQWADGQIANGQAITNNNIGQFYEVNGDAAGMMKNLESQYSDVFEPLINNFAAKAQDWSSEARRTFNMGQAESTAGQADQAGMETLKRNLEREGVNTSSGAMTELMRKSAMDDARNRTFAGNQAGMQTEQMGMQLEQIAGQMGQNIPGMWGMAAGVREAALNAAQNSILGLLNAAASLKRLPVEAYQAAAAAIKTGQQTNSQQQSRSGSTQSDPSNSNSNKDKNNSNPNQQSQGPNGRQNSDTKPSAAPTNTGGLGWRQPPAAVKQTGDDGTGANLPDWYKDPNLGIMPPDSTDWSQNNVPYIDPTGQQIGNQLPDGLPNTNGGAVAPFGPNSPAVQTPTGLGDQQPDWNGPQGAIPNPSGPDQSLFPQNSNPFNPSGDPTTSGGGWNPEQAQQGSGWNGNWGDNPFGDTTGSVPQPDQQQQPDPWQQQTQPDQQPDQQPWQGDPWNDPTAGQGDAGNWNQPVPDEQNWGDQSGGGGGDYSSGDDYSGGGDFAKGGPVRPTTGGFVPRSASPSGGRQTDDIPARLNADEFVIPNDVVHHLGSKHFESLIAKSRKMRTGMAGPKPQATHKPALVGPPRFVSRHMGAR